MTTFYVELHIKGFMWSTPLCGVARLLSRASGARVLE